MVIWRGQILSVASKHCWPAGGLCRGRPLKRDKFHAFLLGAFGTEAAKLVRNWPGTGQWAPVSSPQGINHATTQ